jgi:hypothetical protein
MGLCMSGSLELLYKFCKNFEADSAKYPHRMLNYQRGEIRTSSLQTHYPSKLAHNH